MQIKPKPITRTLTLTHLSRDRQMMIVDGLAAALAASLPWSTSLTGILAGLWLAALIPIIELAGIRRELVTWAGGLPVLLFALGAIGMLWADVPLMERLHGLDSYAKLLFIPLLIFHFRRSERGIWVLNAFLASCLALLIVSWLTAPFPGLTLSRHGTPGVPVKDYVSQSAMFTICIAATLEFMAIAWREAHRKTAILLALLALAFTANIFYIATSRTALVFLPVLILLYSFRQLGWRAAIALFAVLIGLTIAASQSSDFFRQRVSVFKEISDYRASNADTSAGERLEFWRKSLEIIASAPLIGHGTGTIRQQFSLLASGTSGTSSLVAENPHNQTFAVAIQLGLLGTGALYAMWLAHVLLFRGQGTAAAWIGLVIVAQNIIGSLFNSHLFDFTHGWGYVIGAGVAGGIVIAQAQTQGKNADTVDE